MSIEILNNLPDPLELNLQLITESAEVRKNLSRKATLYWVGGTLMPFLPMGLHFLAPEIRPNLFPPETLLPLVAHYWSSFQHASTRLEAEADNRHYYHYNLPAEIWDAIEAINPEWNIDNSIFGPISKRLCLLPPIGGKLALPENRVFDDFIIIQPTLTAEQHLAGYNRAQNLMNLNLEIKPNEYFTHQLTVQGRLPDEFKYMALALIMHSPYEINWDEPSFEAPWGKVAPLIHDGNLPERTKIISPYWSNIPGRTDYLYRVVTKDDPDVEKRRLLIETKAFQRLALAMHCRAGTNPDFYPEKLTNPLTAEWDSFKGRMDKFFQYSLKGVPEPAWFLPKPRLRRGWERYGDRYEADWPPIKKELNKLEEACSLYPEIRVNVGNILEDSTNRIDEIIGLPT